MNGFTSFLINSKKFMQLKFGVIFCQRSLQIRSGPSGGNIPSDVPKYKADDLFKKYMAFEKQWGVYKARDNDNCRKLKSNSSANCKCESLDTGTD